jgi:CRISPR-associated exonuclease Cas4
MFACEVVVGYVFHAASKRRREVIFDWRLRDETKRAIDAVRQLLREGVTPAAELKPRCDGCSLRDVCMPEVTGNETAVVEQYAKDLLL